ncbi:MAG TPA: twin-arginine translocase TatA/TatE family subunit [Chthonomonadaceae bacterium]|nr:twin-arginine translocase TatA/TatE family subunit [Chthonomonadaceae bacterium]
MYTLANANPTIWIVIAIVALVIFGGAKIPEMMKGLGQGMREFKKGMKEDEDPELQREKEREAEIRRRVEEEMRSGSTK